MVILPFLLKGTSIHVFSLICQHKTHATIVATQHKQLGMEYKNAKNMEEADVKYYVIRAWWLSLGATTKDDMYCLSEWLGFWHYYSQWRGHMLIVGVLENLFYHPLLEFMF